MESLEWKGWQWSVLGVEWSFSSYKKDHGSEKYVWEQKCQDGIVTSKV